MPEGASAMVRAWQCWLTLAGQDFFPVCQGHLTDRGFASPVVKTPPPTPSEEEIERKRKEALEKEIELVKKEYEEKLKRKKEKEKEKSVNEKEDKDDKDKGKEGEGAKQTLPEVKKNEEPRAFALHR